MKKIYTLIVLALAACNMFAQSAMNEWNMHLAYNQTYLIAQSPTHVYALSGDAMFSVEKDTKLVEYYSKLNGLTGTTIANIGFDKVNNTLVVVYHNGHIDLIKDGETSSIIDLYNKQLNVASKAPNDIAFQGGKAYMAMQFGIIVLNVGKQEIADTYYIGDNGTDVNLLSICLSDDSIYAVSSDTLYMASLKNHNLLDYSNWQRTAIADTIGKFRQIVYFNDEVVAFTTTGVFRRTEGKWNEIIEMRPKYIFRMRSIGDELLVSAGDGLFIIYKDYTVVQENMIQPVLDADKQGEHVYWVATGEDGIGEMDHYLHLQQNYKPNGPAVNIPYRMRFSGEKLFVVPGGRWAVQYSRQGNVMMYENNTWTNIYYSDIREKTQDLVLDFMDVAAAPDDNEHIFVTSYGTGLYEFQGTELVKRYTVDNSILQSAAPNDPIRYTRTEGAIFDRQGNLFLINGGGVENSIIIRTAAGDWIGQNLTYNNYQIKFETPGEMHLDYRNADYKWIVSARVPAGLILWDNGGTITDASDDEVTFRTQFVDQNNNTLRPDAVYCFAQDHNGTIWLGTDLGPIIIPTSVNFKSSGSCRRVLLNRDDGTGLADYLLDGVQINCIAIDGANRKWIGTATSGLYLLSEDGTQTIEHFTTANSPLISDEILSLAINSRTGEVFIGTGAGLMSYQSDAADPKDSFDDVYAYPNPVREDHDGMITIAGLMDNSSVKIVDTAGRLVYETTSHGSLAVWDGNNPRGQRVPTGVYIVLVNSEDGSKHSTTKILIVNK